MEAGNNFCTYENSYFCGEYLCVNIGRHYTGHDLYLPSAWLSSLHLAPLGCGCQVLYLNCNNYWCVKENESRTAAFIVTINVSFYNSHFLKEKRIWSACRRLDATRLEFCKNLSMSIAALLGVLDRVCRWSLEYFRVVRPKDRSPKLESNAILISYAFYSPTRSSLSLYSFIFFRFSSIMASIARFNFCFSLWMEKLGKLHHCCGIQMLPPSLHRPCVESPGK